MKLLPSVHKAEFDGEYVLMDEISGQFYGLNKTGGIFVHIIEEELNPDEILQELSIIWQLDFNQLNNDFNYFIETLREKGLLE